MKYKVQLYTTKKNQINEFLKEFFCRDFNFEDKLNWEKEYDNPIELAEIIGGFIDNNYKFSINMWISIDEGVLINVTDSNADELIKYLYERFPY